MTAAAPDYIRGAARTVRHFTIAPAKTPLESAAVLATQQSVDREVHEAVRQALRLAGHKLGVRTRIVERHES